MEDSTREHVNNILKVALHGEKVRGNNGAVLIDDDTSDIVYLLSHEFKPDDFSERLNEMLTEDGCNFVYIVHKTKDSMHVSKIPRGI